MAYRESRTVRYLLPLLDLSPANDTDACEAVAFAITARRGYGTLIAAATTDFRLPHPKSPAIADAIERDTSFDITDRTSLEAMIVRNADLDLP